MCLRLLGASLSDPHWSVSLDPAGGYRPQILSFVPHSKFLATPLSTDAELGA